MRISLISLIILACNSFFVYAQNNPAGTKISGNVLTEKNKPINGANIVVEGTIDGATTDTLGYFEFETSKTGAVNLIITAIGYNDKEISLTLEQGKDLKLSIKLAKGKSQTDEIIVTASSYTSGQQSQVTLTPLEIVRIPGSDADLYRALITFPGTSQVDEGSRITVRGGNADEVLTILDQASLYNPFIFDDDFNTSSFSTINPWGLRGINFSSGGFSSKYGNALSGILDLKTYDMPQGTGIFAWLGLANIGLSGVYVSPFKKFGATFDMGHTFLEPYFRLNGFLIEQYNPIPLARGAGGTLSYNPTERSNLKSYFNYSEDKIGIRNTSPSYDGFFYSSSKTYFANIKYTGGFGPSILFGTSISYSRHDDYQKYGVLENTIKEDYAKIRTDLTYQMNNKLNFNTGAEYEYNREHFKGTVPLYSYNLKPDAPSMFLDSKTHTGRFGTYFETEWKATKKFFTIGGIRFDYHSLSGKYNIAPRFTAGFKINKENTVRGAIGLYHQYPSLQYYAQTLSNDLKPEQAIHYILGYEFNKMEGFLMLRIEAYYKDYKNLVLMDKNYFVYNSNGYGNANGIDIFLKSSLTNKYSAWISYSYTHSKRKQYDVTEMAPAKYDIRHSLSFVGSYNITDWLTTGLSYKISTGKPFTPVTGSYFDSTQNLYAPVYGEANSDRYPTYHRFDINLQYIFSLFGKFAIAVFQVNNLFNNKNLYGYTYNPDYSKRIEIITTNKRQFYVGLGVQL
jgi:hypothetical protein